jgi:hypothetical protein
MSRHDPAFARRAERTSPAAGTARPDAAFWPAYYAPESPPRRPDRALEALEQMTAYYEG